MAKGILVGNFGGSPGELIFNAETYGAKYWTVFFADTSFGSSQVTIWAGDGTNYERLEIQSPVTGTWYTRAGSGASNNLRPYLIPGGFPFYKFIAVGGAPVIGIVVYPGGLK